MAACCRTLKRLNCALSMINSKSWVNHTIFSFGLVAEWHMMVGKILVQTKLNEMLESLGEGKKKKQRQLTSVSLIFLLSLVSCFAFGFKTFLVIYLGLIRNKFQNCFSTKCSHLENGSSSFQNPLECYTRGKGKICYPFRKHWQNLKQSVSWSNLFLEASCLHWRQHFQRNWTMS